MARREYYYSPQCAEEGCTELANYVFSTRREQQEQIAYLNRHPWRCVRHNRAGVVLSPDEPIKEAVLEIYETDFGYGRSTHKFWTEPENVAEKKHGNGFKYGPGFKAFAEDFPPGTRLIVTARVEIPAASRDSQAKETHDG